MHHYLMKTADPFETEPHKGIRFSGSRIKPKRNRFGLSAPEIIKDCLTTSETAA
jgi:hypothetical protein